MREMTRRQKSVVDEVTFHFAVHDNGDVTLTWRFDLPCMDMPETSGYYCVGIGRKELTTWRHVLDVVEAELRVNPLPKEAAGAASRSYFIHRVRNALADLFSMDSQREICDFLGIANADPAANGVVPQWRSWIDLMKREGKPIPSIGSDGQWYGDLTEYEFAWTKDGTLWVMWNLTDSDGTRSMPHWRRHVLPTQWLRDGWEAFLDRYTEAFPEPTELYPRSKLEKRSVLQAFLGL